MASEQDIKAEPGVVRSFKSPNCMSQVTRSFTEVDQAVKVEEVDSCSVEERTEEAYSVSYCYYEVRKLQLYSY